MAASTFPSDVHVRPLSFERSIMKCELLNSSVVVHSSSETKSPCFCAVNARYLTGRMPQYSELSKLKGTYVGSSVTGPPPEVIATVKFVVVSSVILIVPVVGIEKQTW